ncbi:MAG: gliding motility-associated C-terminal domain-containing protein [Bacteroidales bacterium]
MNLTNYTSLFLCFFFGVLSMSMAQNTSLVLDSVSVNPNNQVVISWDLETEVENGYVKIERNLDDGTFNTVIRLPLTTSIFTDNSINAQNRSYSYYVVPYDESDDQIIPAEKIHSTIFLHQPVFNVCEREILLQWENYRVSDFVQFPEPVDFPFDSTAIFVSVNGSEFIQHKVVPADSTHLAIPHQTNATYCFRVRSFDVERNMSSTSNTSCIEANYVDLPGNVNTQRVSLTEDSEGVEIDLLIDDPADNLTFVLEKFNHDTNGFVSFDTVVNPNDPLSLISFIDRESQANLFSESYRAIVLDSCLHIAQTTDSVATIFLSVSRTTSNINTLEWNHYNGWENSDLFTDHYAVLRKTGIDSDFEVISMVEPDVLAFQDQNGTVADQDIFYRIIAVSNLSTETGLVVEVNSNIAIMENSPQVFIPNAFHPKSNIEQNRVFKPVFSNFSPSDYSMNIYNRWGESIFTTQDENQHWDGQDQGRSLPAGLYYYVIQYVDSRGQKHTRRGEVLMIW